MAQGKKFTHLDLFSGIGGFALAAMQVWGKDYECVGFCDIEPYAQQLLKIRFPGVPIYENIKTLTAERLIADTENIRQRKSEQRQGEKTTKGRGNNRGIDLITGGFPCQPFSMAGKRRGTDDDRHLWPEMLRVIKEVKPTRVIGENVAGILSMGGADEPGVETETDNAEENSGEYDTGGVVWGIINDLESIGYAVQTFVIPACAVGAPHRRDRIWIVANSGHGNGEGNAVSGEYEKKDRQQTTAELKRPVKRNEPGADTDPDRNGLQEPRPEQQTGGDRQLPETIADTESGSDRRHERQKPQERQPVSGGGQDDKPTTADTTSRRQQEQRTDREQSQTDTYEPCGWAGENWLEVATRLCGVDDGLPAELDGFKLSKAGHRVARLKSLGNSIVPQVVTEIMYAIKAIDDGEIK